MRVCINYAAVIFLLLAHTFKKLDRLAFEMFNGAVYHSLSHVCTYKNLNNFILNSFYSPLPNYTWLILFIHKV